ncbi:MAG: hypothetical protein JNM17_32490 [Archangium sp.]|nr:hypothetical protein [Archangium sp.]
MNRTYSLNVSSRDVLAANLIEELSNDAGPDFALLGRAIALSNDVVLLGAPGEDLVAPDGGMLSRAGRAYVFERTDGGWAASATLSPPTPHTVGEFGTAVALDTDTAAISEPEYGQVHVFARDDAGWRYVQSVRGSNTESGNGSQADLDGFGNAVALGLGRLVVGAPREDDSAVGVGPPNNDENALNSGAVYVFTRDTDGGWPQTDYLKADARSVGAQFGSALAFDGRRLVVGAPFEATNVTGINPTRPMTSPSLDESGAVFVFDKGNSWNQVVWAKAPNPDQGDWFGLSVALSGARVVIGAPRERSAQRTQPADNGLMEAGAAYVLTQDAGWAFTDYLKATTPTMTESFGASVGVSGDVIAVGAPRARSGAVEHGAAYVFSTLDGASWVDRGKYSSTRPEIGQRFGEPLVVGPNSFIGCAAVASPQSRGACWERRFQSP